MAGESWCGTQTASSRGNLSCVLEVGHEGPHRDAEELHRILDAWGQPRAEEPVNALNAALDDIRQGIVECMDPIEIGDMKTRRVGTPRCPSALADLKSAYNTIALLAGRPMWEQLSRVEPELRPQLAEDMGVRLPSHDEEATFVDVTCRFYFDDTEPAVNVLRTAESLARALDSDTNRRYGLDPVVRSVAICAGGRRLDVGDEILARWLDRG